ncbi:hypothetical protein V6Z12_D04G112500 [Gossypium hirsutum]
MEAFNRALLRKQGSRLPTNPTSLIGRILKARYFPITEFPQSVLGQNPSFTWRSIWGIKDLLHCSVRCGRLVMVSQSEFLKIDGCLGTTFWCLYLLRSLTY